MLTLLTAVLGLLAALVLLHAAPLGTAYDTLVIEAPRHEQTLFDSEGRVNVRLRLAPPLRAEQGHRVRVLLDEQMQPDAWGEAAFALAAVPRGTHRLQVLIVDGSGGVLAASPAMQFHMWQASRQMRKPAP